MIIFLWNTCPNELYLELFLLSEKFDLNLTEKYFLQCFPFKILSFCSRSQNKKYVTFYLTKDFSDLIWKYVEKKLPYISSFNLETHLAKGLNFEKYFLAGFHFDWHLQRGLQNISKTYPQKFSGRKSH